MQTNILQSMILYNRQYRVKKKNYFQDSEFLFAYSSSIYKFVNQNFIAIVFDFYKNHRNIKKRLTRYVIDFITTMHIFILHFLNYQLLCLLLHYL